MEFSHVVLLILVSNVLHNCIGNLIHILVGIAVACENFSLYCSLFYFGKIKKRESKIISKEILLNLHW